MFYTTCPFCATFYVTCLHIIFLFYLDQQYIYTIKIEVMTSFMCDIFILDHPKNIY